MKEKGTILIVEDRFEEKIGSFLEQLNKGGYNVETAETLEKADELLNKLLKSNALDGLILDFSFPVNDDDKSAIVDGIPSRNSTIKKIFI